MHLLSVYSVLVSALQEGLPILLWTYLPPLPFSPEESLTIVKSTVSGVTQLRVPYVEVPTWEAAGLPIHACNKAYDALQVSTNISLG